MSVDHLQINVADVVYDNSTWLYSFLSGAHNDINDALIDFNAVLGNIVGLTRKGARISSTDTSGSDNMQWEVQDPVYSGNSYLSSSDAITLRNSLITQLVTIGSLQNYKDVYVRSYRNDLQHSTNYSYGVSNTNGLEIFISGIVYNSQTYLEPSDTDTFLSSFNTAFDTISGLEYAGIVVSTWKSTTDGIFIGIDDASYNGLKYLMFTDAATLRSAIINAIATISGVNDENIEVEVRIAKKDNIPST
jgi:hypothetical protein